MTNDGPVQPGLLRRLGILGYDAIEPVILAALAEESPLLLIGEHGTAKSLLLNRLSEALALRHRHYNASLLNFDDLVGYPYPNADHTALSYLHTPATIWEAESVFFDEISRCRLDLQNKLFPIIHERTVQGMPLEALRYCWAAMNPPADPDAAEEDATSMYRGSEPLDPALADRFAFILPVPGLEALSQADQRAILAGAGESVAAEAAGNLQDAVHTIRMVLPALTEQLTAPIAEYVQVLAGKLAAMRRPISPRRGRQCVRNIIAVHAATLGQQDISLANTAFATVLASLPHPAYGLPLDGAAVLAAHRAAWEVVKLTPDDPQRLVLCELDPLKRLALAICLRLEILPLSTILLDVLSGLLPWQQRACATALFPAIANTVDLTTVAYDTLAEQALPAVGFETTNVTFRPGTREHHHWKATVDALARAPRITPGLALLQNLAMSLLAGSFSVEPDTLIGYWQQLVALFWSSGVPHEGSPA